MTPTTATRNEPLAPWREAIARLSAETGTSLGLMPDSMAWALHAAAQPGSGPSAGMTPPAEAGWGDWWEKRQQLATRDVTVQDLARASLDSLARAQAATGACVEPLNDLAMAQARQLDARLAAGQPLGLLGGMPLAHKDLLHRAGHPVGYGMGKPLDAATADAAVLRRFDQAGALHLARLHMTELAFDPSGTNAMAGHCRNPWSALRIPGGSSSGSAAVVAAGAVYGALGSDTGGSIRIPAALCGVTGLKPTFGLVSRTGAMSLSATHDHLGPIARSARDCALMLQAIAGHDSADAGSVAAPPGGDYAGSLDAPLDGLRIGVPQGYFAAGLHPRIQAVVAQCVESFRMLGADIREVPDFPYADVNALAIMMIRAEAAALYENLLRVGAAPALGEFTRARLREGEPIPATLYLQALALRGPLLQRFGHTVLAGVDALLAPVFPLPTPRIDAFDAIDAGSQLLRGELTRLTRPFNYLGLPSLSLPGGACAPEDDPVELPVGFQLIGRPYSEALLLRLGHAFQKATQWHLRRPPVWG
ncbi:amidase [Bordetella petrii]|uniref:amidase n=1 Tax=Bordetella petrii TaxID=94624 RepID=UPI001E5E0CA6|nr:amidase [Bordetella petrii]MCD0504213.1 amidase [Bordetella petrii]